MKSFVKLIALAAAVAAVVLVGIRIHTTRQAAQYGETAAPYVRKVVPEISRWDPAVMRQYMPPEVLEEMPEGRMEQIVAYLSRLGALKEMGEPKFSSVTVQTVPGGEKTVVTYTVEVEYENGDGEMTVGLLSTDGTYRVHNFHVASEALAAESSQ